MPAPIQPSASAVRAIVRAMSTPTLTCPLCAGTSFQSEQERTDGRWGLTTHVKLLLICDECRYVLTFYDTNSIFDFD